MMYKLLVVDDKLDSINAIKKLIDWQAEGITSVFYATNGVEGYRVFQQHMPDIIITDIKMPKMDGLELLEKVKSTKPSTQVIILSGYDEFSFAQKAMKFDAQEYLLKPVSIEEIKQATHRSMAIIEREREKRKDEIGLREQMQDMLAIKKKHYLNNLIQTSVKNLDEMKKKFHQYNIQIEAAYISSAIIRIDNYSVVEAEKSIDEIEVMRYTMRSIIKDTLRRYNLEIFVCSDRELCLLINYDKEDITYFSSILKESLISCKEKIRQMLKLSVTISIGRGFKAYDEIVDAFRSAKETLKYRMVLGRDQVFSYYDIDQVKHEAVLRSLEIMKSIELSLRSVSKEFTDLLFLWGDKIKEVYDIFEIKRLMYQMIAMINKTSYNYGIDDPDIQRKIMAVKKYCEGHGDINELIFLLDDCMNDMVYYIQNSKQEKNREEILKAQEYIERYYHENISLRDVAAYVNLSPTYLSYLLKNSTGKTFTNIVVEKRIEEAKELLMTNRYKVYEVAEKVGYSDRRYFSEMFKKYTQLNPKDFISKYVINK